MTVGNNVGLRFPIEGPDVFLKKIHVKAADLGNDEWVDVRLAMNQSFVPKNLNPPLNNDDRELGLLVYHLYVTDVASAGTPEGVVDAVALAPARAGEVDGRGGEGGGKAGCPREEGPALAARSCRRGSLGRTQREAARPSPFFLFEGGRGGDDMSRVDNRATARWTSRPGHGPDPREDPRPARPRALHRRRGRGADGAQAPGLRRRGRDRPGAARPAHGRQPQLEHLDRLPDRDPPPRLRRAGSSSS